LLPGSNLTNLIVLGHLHLSGAAFAKRMGLPWLVAVGLTGAVIAVIGRRELRLHVRLVGDPDRPVIGVGLAAVTMAALLVVLLKTPALPVLAVGVLAAGARVSTRRISLESALAVLGVPVLLGLFGVAVGLGVVGRDWDLPARAMAHLDPWATAGAAAVAAVIFNNLPAASLLSARVPAHPLSLLIGLNLGPNLFVSGSLAWLLWMRAVRGAGGDPPVRRTVKIGLVAAPLSIAGAVGALLLAGHLT
jgi:arsenical pump membrane protein